MSNIRRFFLILALTAMWSPSFLFIKLAIQSFPPFTAVFFRVFIASLLLCGVLIWLRRRVPSSPLFWFHAACGAFFGLALPFSLFCYAEKSIDSALAAIINGTTPTFTALLAHALLPKDRLNSQKVIGIIFSSVGLLWLFAPSIQQGLSGNAMGILAASCAAVSYAVSHIYSKKYLTGYLPFVVPMAQFFATSVMVGLLACLWEQPWTLPAPSVLSIVGVCGLAIFGTFTAFVIYYYLLEHCGPTAVSMVACFFPVGGMALGYLFLGETLTLTSLMAASLILLGMMTVNELIKIRLPVPANAKTMAAD